MRVRLIVVVGRHADAVGIDDQRAAGQPSGALQMSVPTGDDGELRETGCSGGDLVGSGRTGTNGIDGVEEYCWSSVGVPCTAKTP